MCQVASSMALQSLGEEFISHVPTCELHFDYLVLVIHNSVAWDARETHTTECQCLWISFCRSCVRWYPIVKWQDCVCIAHVLHCVMRQNTLAWRHDLQTLLLNQWIHSNPIEGSGLSITRQLQPIKMSQSILHAKNTNSGHQVFFTSYSIATEKKTGGFWTKPSK